MGGSLAKALIVANEAGLTCRVQFNPKELQVQRDTQWQAAQNAKEDDGTQEFTKPSSATLTVTLIFDSYESGDDCYGAIQPLEKMGMIMEGKARPPLCVFQWGSSFTFEGVVQSVTQKYTMFHPDGRRARCEVSLTMIKANKVEVAKPGGGT